MTRHPPKCSLGFSLLNEARAMGSVRLVKERRMLREPVPKCDGAGCVIAGGGKYLDWAWVLCRWLRIKGFKLPIQVWYLGAHEMPAAAVPKFRALGVEVVDAVEVRKKFPHMDLTGWTLKAFAVMRCPFRHVLFLDADCFPARNPEELFWHRDLKETGSLFFSDIKPCRKSNWGYVFCGLKAPEKEWESGQWVVDKVKAWQGLQMVSWMNEHRRFWDLLGHGDKFTLELGMRTVEAPHVFSMECEWGGWGISQRWKGVEWFRHAMAFKRGESNPPFPEIPGLFEEFRCNPVVAMRRAVSHCAIPAAV